MFEEFMRGIDFLRAELWGDMSLPLSHHEETECPEVWVV